MYCQAKQHNYKASTDFLISISVYLQAKQHKKDPQILPMIKRFFAFHLETHYRQDPDEPIVLLFDLCGAGLSNLVSIHTFQLGQQVFNPLSADHNNCCLFCLQLVILKVIFAISVDPDQTAPREAVWSGSTLFACMQKLVWKVARIFSRQHKRMKFSDAGFLGVLRVNACHICPTDLDKITPFFS